MRLRTINHTILAAQDVDIEFARRVNAWACNEVRLVGVLEHHGEQTVRRPGGKDPYYPFTVAVYDGGALLRTGEDGAEVRGPVVCDRVPCISFGKLAYVMASLPAGQWVDVTGWLTNTMVGGSVVKDGIGTVRIRRGYPIGAVEPGDYCAENSAVVDFTVQRGIEVGAFGVVE